MRHHPVDYSLHDKDPRGEDKEKGAESLLKENGWKLP